MKPSQVAAALGVLLDANLPVFLWGPPGVGKSDLVRQEAARRGWPVMDRRVIVRDPTDFAGIPYLDGPEGARRSRFAAPGWLPYIEKDGEFGIIFFDEAPNGEIATQKAMLKLALEGELDEYAKPPGWRIVLAGNRLEDRAGANRIITSLASRLVHLDLEADLDDWCRWALANGIGVHIVAFLRMRPELLMAFDPAAVDAARTFPCPRTWAMVSRVLGPKLANGAIFDLVRGTVGEGAATEFVAFLQAAAKMPNLDHVLLHPDKAEVPTEPAALYAVSAGIGSRMTKDNMERAVKYLERLPEEFNVLSMHDATMREPTLLETRAGIKWATKHADAIS